MSDVHDLTAFRQQELPAFLTKARNAYIGYTVHDLGIEGAGEHFDTMIEHIRYEAKVQALHDLQHLSEEELEQMIAEDHGIEYVI